MRSVPWTVLAAVTLALGIGACNQSGGKGKDTTNSQTGDSDDPATDTDDPATDTDDPATDTDDPATDTDDPATDTDDPATDTDDPATDTDDPATDTDDPATDTDDPATDTDGGGDDDPVDNNATPLRTATTFCAAGGRWSNGQVQGVGCLAPLDVATQAASNDQYTWRPGPTVVVGGQ